MRIVCIPGGTDKKQMSVYTDNKGVFRLFMQPVRKGEKQMRKKENGRNRSFLWKMGVAAVLTAVSLAGTGRLPFIQGQSVVTAYAQEDMLGYENPEDIVIAMPNKNNYSTTAGKISILGACDYNFPLTMNGEEVETTEHGFFTKYVTLNVGENTFEFVNGEHTYTLTVIRKKSSTGGSGSGSGTAAPKYKEVSGKIAELIYPYSMPYSSPGTVQIDYWPLTQYTTFRIVGEYGNYYKLPDGTYIDKSSVKVYNYKMPANTVTKAAAVYAKETHTFETTFQMKIDALYDVQFDGNTVKFVLYDTTAGKAPAVPTNPLVTKISSKTDSKGRAIYTYTVTDASKICGFDVMTKDGTMTFMLKYVPVLKEQGSLAGAVVLLDAGHGKTDSGTVGCMGAFGPCEKDTNLDLTLRVKEALEKMGAKVVLVRDTDVFYSLNERVKLIRTTKPDLSISIHGNAVGITSDYSTAAGFLTYYSYSGLQDAAAVINTSVCKSMGYTVRSTRKANLSLTRLTACPAVLLETAFLTYPEDYEFLLKEENRDKLAKAIANAAKEYLEGVAEYEPKKTTSEKTDTSDAPKTYTVKKGDTLSSIAKKYNTTVAKLAERNKIKNINVIRTGQVLILP